MQRENNRTKLLTRRAVLLGGAQVALLATLAGRMYYLQVMQAGRYVMLADENRISIRLLAPPRGRIVDRFGVPLADNAPTYRVVLVAEQAGDIPSTLDAVATLIPVGDADRHRVLRDIKRKHSFVPVDHPREPDLGRDGADRGQHAGAARRLDRAGPDALLPAGRCRLARAGLCRRRLRQGAHRRRSAARAARFPRRQERRGEAIRSRAARQRRHQRGRGQRLWPRGARAGARGRHPRPGDRAQPRRRPAGSGGQALHRRAQRLLRAARQLDRRGAGAGLEPGLRPGRLLLGSDPGGVAEARRRSARSAERQGDRRRLCAGLDLQAAGRDDSARIRRDHARDHLLLPGLLPSRQHRLPLLEAWRPRHDCGARGDQAVLRRVLLQRRRPPRHRSHRRHGA